MATAYRYAQRVRANGTTIPVASIDISLGLSTPMEWTVKTVPDPDRSYCPRLVSNCYPQVFSAAKTINKFWDLTFYIGGMTKAFNNLVFQKAARGTNISDTSSTFGGTDYSRLLLLQNQSLDSWVSDSSHIYTAKEILADILDEFGVTSYALNFEDYNVRECHFQGQNVIDLINSLLEIRGAYWYFDAKKFIAKVPNYNTVGQDWVYNSGTDPCISVQWEANPNSIINEVVVNRTESVPAAERFERQGSDACGEQRVTLQEPKYHPQFRVLPFTSYGEVKNVHWLDAGGNITTSNIIAYGAYFVFKQDIFSNTAPGIQLGQAHWGVEISGVPASLSGLTSSFDDAFSKKISETTSQTQYGLLPAASPIENPLIPDEEVALEYGRRVIWDSLVRKEKVTVEVPFNPFLIPGHVVKLTDYMSGISGVNWFVEEVSHSLSNTNAITSFTAYLCTANPF